jgi:predicted transcriptional regulator
MLKRDKSRQGSPTPASPFNNLSGLETPVLPILQRRPSQVPGNKLFYKTASQNTAMRRKRERSAEIKELKQTMREVLNNQKSMMEAITKLAE